MTRSGWCMTRRHGHYCRWNLCQCDCHDSDVPTDDASRMSGDNERPRQRGKRSGDWTATKERTMTSSYPCQGPRESGLT